MPLGRVETKLKGAFLHLMAEIALNFFPSLLALFAPSFVPTLDSRNFRFIEIYCIHRPLNFTLFPGIEQRTSLILAYSNIFRRVFAIGKVSTNFQMEISFHLECTWYNVRSKEASRSYVGFLYIDARGFKLFIFLSQRFEVSLHFTSWISRNRVVFFNASPRRATIRGWIMNKTRK